MMHTLCSKASCHYNLYLTVPKFDFYVCVVVIVNSTSGIISLRTASVCIGCAANSRPATVANHVSSPATTLARRVNSTQQEACRAMFTAWNHIGCRPHSQWSNLQHIIFVQLCSSDSASKKYFYL